jgi:hypothetical protein
LARTNGTRQQTLGRKSETAPSYFLTLIHVVAKEEILKNRKNENLKIMEDYLGG